MCEVIRFNYLYRDSGNYKKFGSKNFGNPEQLPIEDIERNIFENLIDNEYFYPDKVGIKKFKIHRCLDDFSWYEFESIEILHDANPLTNEIDSISYLLLKFYAMKYQK